MEDKKRAIILELQKNMYMLNNRAEICVEYGLSEDDFYPWICGYMEASEKIVIDMIKEL